MHQLCAKEQESNFHCDKNCVSESIAYMILGLVVTQSNPEYLIIFLACLHARDQCMYVRMLFIGGASESARDWVCTQIPLQRLGTRTEIAEAAVFMASPLSSYATGTVLVVDGGHWMTTGRTMESLSSKM